MGLWRGTANNAVFGELAFLIYLFLSSLKLETLKKDSTKSQEALNVSKEQLCTETQRTKSLCQEM